jgi:hypothetical protein
MAMNVKWALLGAVTALSACTATGSASGETSIPYVSRDGIVEWEVAADDALYIKAVNGDWYYVRTGGRCPRLRTAISLGFVTSALDQLDRHGAIIAEGQRCQVASVAKSVPPPTKAEG